MEITIALETLHCCECEGVFLIPARQAKKLRDEGGTFHCPKGHAQVFTRPVVEKMQQMLNDAYARADMWQERAEAAEAELKRLRRKSRAAK